MSLSRHRSRALLIRLSVIALLWAGSAVAGDASGRWVVDTGATPVFTFDVKYDAHGWSGVWRRPKAVEIASDELTEVQGPAETRVSSSGKAIADGVELTFIDPAPGHTPDVFQIHMLDSDHARLSYAGFGIEPLPLRRSHSVQIGPFTGVATYRIARNRPTDAEMTRLFEADQAARQTPMKIDWAVVGPQDEERRRRTQALLTADRLQSGDDFFHAAFVFQHGDKATDYLEAHLLAMVAVARGKAAATWIASATLDRYLMAIKQPQVVGTQYTFPRDGPDAGHATQEPYDRKLLPDSLRTALGVRTLAEQEETRRQFERDAQADTKAP